MITTPQDYYSKLYLIQDTNKQVVAELLPNDEKIYNVDLSTRKIETPLYLSIEKDHLAETIYFLVDRFYDTVDLSATTCVVQYVNALGEPRVYAVPFVDTITFEKDGKMIIPWCIEGEATKAAGNIQYALKFYHLYKDEDDVLKFDFNLNTSIAKSKILSGLDTIKNNGDYDYVASAIEEALSKIDWMSKQEIEWIEL